MADRTYMAHMLWFGGEDKFDGDLLHLFIFENDWNVNENCWKALYLFFNL